MDLRTISDDLLDEMRTARLPVDADDDTFIAAVRNRNLAGAEYGRRCGWWRDYTAGGDPLPLPRVVEMRGYEGKTMAHVMADLGWFKSVGEARRNGWDKPVAPGLYSVGKTKQVEVITE